MHKKKINKNSWHTLVFAQFPIILIVSHLLAQKCYINVLKMKKIDNFVLNCSRCMVQTFVLEVLMSSFERYLSSKITIPKGYLPPGGS